MNLKRDKYSSKLDSKTLILLKYFFRVLTKLKYLV